MTAGGGHTISALPVLLNGWDYRASPNYGQGTAPSVSALCHVQTQREEIKTDLMLPTHTVGFAPKASWTQKS